jgi:hypothetical protein
MSSKIYIIDTSILIEAKNRYYAFAICPGFWDALIYHNSQTTIQSIDKVKEEINKHKIDDDLKNWVNTSIPEAFFKSTKDDEIQKWYEEIINWVQENQQYKPEAKSEFIQDVCDPYLISYAKAKDCILIANEAYRPDAKAKVLIPNVCHQFNIEYENPFKMLEILGTQFILKK